MKSYTKSQLAAMADVSVTTFRRWMKHHEEALDQMGVARNARLLPPIAVKYLCDKFGIVIEE